jgi:hypothetical protein
MNTATTMPTIATMANRIKKPTKIDVVATILQLDNLLRQITDTQALNKLSEIYSYFMAAQSASPKTIEKWLCKSIANQDVRYYLNFAYCDGENLIATTGHILARIPNNNQFPADQYFDKQLQPVVHQGKYPDCERVIESTGFDAERHWETVTLADCECKAWPEYGDSIQIYADTWINLKYLRLLFGRQKTVTITNATQLRKAHTAVRFLTPEKYNCSESLAIIMPIRV